MKTKTPSQQMNLADALRYLKTAAERLEAAGEGLASMRVSALLRGLK